MSVRRSLMRGRISRLEWVLPITGWEKERQLFEADSDSTIRKLSITARRITPFQGRRAFLITQPDPDRSDFLSALLPRRCRRSRRELLHRFGVSISVPVKAPI